jgi:cbb3-type cytochrome oxidase subunit 3
MDPRPTGRVLRRSTTATRMENDMSQLAGFVSEYGLYGASLIAFVAIVVWIFRPSAKKRYQADGRIPFDEDKRPGKTL